MNVPLTTESLTENVASSLGWLADLGFKYFKSHKHFRLSHAERQSCIRVDSVTHDRLSYHVAFYLSVQIPEVETLILDILGQSRKLTHFDRTIWNYTVNIGPDSSNWTYPIRGTWTIGRMQDYAALEQEISTFIRDLALPFLFENSTPSEIRRTLVEHPRHATNTWPYHQILAIDMLCGSIVQLEEDIALLDKRYEKYAPHPRRDFDEFVSLVRMKSGLRRDE